MASPLLGNPPYPVPAEAVHVWRGYRNATLTPAQFLGYLGATFVLAATLMQPAIGLRGYLPGIFSSEELPQGVPEETALLFWDSKGAYAAAFDTLAERVYTLTHAPVYDLSESKVGFPAALASPLEIEQPYYLLDQPVDWMLGQGFQLMVAVPGGTSSQLADLGSWAQGVAGGLPAGLQGAYLLVGASYIAWWELWAADAAPSATLRDALSAYGEVVANGSFVPAALTAALDAPWPGITVQAGDLYNMQFNRPSPPSNGGSGS